MGLAPPPKVIMVTFYEEGLKELHWWSPAATGSHSDYVYIMSRARTECLMDEHALPIISRSLFRRIFGPRHPYGSQVQAACRFVVDNYRSGDSVMLFGWTRDGRPGDLRYIALRELALALGTGSYSDSRSNRSGGRIPLKCVCIINLRFGFNQWSGFDQVLSDFSPIIESIVFMSGCDVHAVQRGTKGQIKRKEMWRSNEPFDRNQRRWILALQTSHIVDYNPDDLRSPPPTRWSPDRCLAKGLQLVTSMVQLNYTRRRGGLPCDDAIPTGGQLTRISKL
ncbi:hypothetical protein BDV93DRAFT_520019, partial [Ceratobasidium sp. AG-I]